MNMLLVIVISIVLLLLFLFIKTLRYWERRSIPGPRPLPLVGNYGANIIGKKNSFEISGDIYKEYEEYPFVGVFRMGNPGLLVRDPEIIKNILVKDFSYFLNNDIFVDKKLDPLFGLNPFVLKNEEWKTERQLLSPSFAPAKIKTLFPLVESIAKNFAKYLEANEGKSFNAKDICGRYTCDTVALCAFGLEENSFEKPQSQFLQTLRKLFSANTLQSIKLAASLFIPHLKIKIIPQSFDDDIINMTKEILKYRKDNNIKRNDYFQAMSETCHSLVDIAGHLTGFIADGYETSSTAITFMFYELAANPKCQQKLREEINTAIEKNNGEFSYEVLNEMVYLDACINESLRKHPPLGQLTKTCNKTYTVSTISPEFKKLSVTLEPGLPVIVPLLGLHKDPKYFSSPEEFMPERFLGKSEAHKYVYLPFGTGPRICLGSRFGLLQSKVAIVTLIKHFEFSLDEKTPHPLKYDPFYFLLIPKGGVFIKFRKISK